MLKRLWKSDATIQTLAFGLTSWLRFIRATGPTIEDPKDFISENLQLSPIIAAMWHGQHFVTPFGMPKDYPVAVMISRSADGSVQAKVAHKFGLQIIRASGAQKKHQVAKRGGAKGFLEALNHLENGVSVAMTCDVPKGPARRCGDGIVHLASRSGRPVVPLAVATSRRIVLKNTWDQAVVNLPFSKISAAFGQPIHVPSDIADNVETYRLAIEESMNEATNRAYDIVDGRRHA